jgi:hypothetical protein
MTPYDWQDRVVGSPEVTRSLLNSAALQGIEALLSLLSHSDPEVVTRAAVLLLDRAGWRAEGR